MPPIRSFFSTRSSDLFSWKVIVLICYGTLIFSGAIHHESWLDEAQAWLLARDLSLTELLQYMNYEGSPALWHLILMPFAKMGFPYESIKFVHITITFATAILIVYKVPFPRLTKLLFLFSYYMSWEYAIIARSYIVTLLLLFSIATVYKNRFTRPFLYSVLIFLLFNTNAHSFLMATGLVMLYFYDSREAKISIRTLLPTLLMMSSGALVVVLQLWSAEDDMSNTIVSWSPHYFAPLKATVHAFFPLFHLLETDETHSLRLFAYVQLSWVGCVIFGYSILYLFSQSPRVALLYLFGVCGLFYIFLFQTHGWYRHHGFIMIFLMFSIWIANYYQNQSEAMNKYNKKRLMQLLNISFAVSIIPNVLMHVNDFQGLYSGSKAMATYIKKLNLTNRVIIGGPTQEATSLAPYLPGQEIWYPGTQRMGTYIVWDKKFKKNIELDFKEFETRVNERHFDHNNSLLLLNSPMPVESAQGYHLLYKIEEEVFGGKRGERYYLYQRKEGR